MTLGANEQVAEQLLSICNDSLEMAINMHMEGVDVTGQGSPSQAAVASTVHSNMEEASGSKSKVGSTSLGRGAGPSSAKVDCSDEPGR